MHFLDSSYDVREYKKSLQYFAPQDKEKNKNNVLFGFWHQDEMSLIGLMAGQGKNTAIMVSQSQDGEILSSALNFLSYQTIRGSSSKGAIAVFMNSLRAIKKGHNLGVAVDGPRGPIYECKEGIIEMSKKANIPIVPLMAFPQKYYEFSKSWSRSRLPYPFTKVHILVGAKSYFQTSEEFNNYLKGQQQNFKTEND